MKQSSLGSLKLLGLYYLVQGVLLIAVGVGGVLLVDQNQLLVIKEWLRVIRLDPDNRFIYWLLTRILPVSNEQLEAFSVGFFVYGGLAFIQGGGLWFSKAWASYLSVVVVGSFIPWQLYSLRHEMTALKLLSLSLNTSHQREEHRGVVVGIRANFQLGRGRETMKETSRRVRWYWNGTLSSSYLMRLMGRFTVRLIAMRCVSKEPMKLSHSERLWEPRLRRFVSSSEQQPSQNEQVMATFKECWSCAPSVVPVLCIPPPCAGNGVCERDGLS